MISYFYFWTAVPGGGPELISRDGPGYYNLLARGFLKGQLSLDTEADPFLATLKDPTDPAQRAGHGMFDVSYYRGRYYLYWGVTPALVCFVPFRLITGRFLDESLVPPIFASVGLIASVWLFLSLRRRYCPNASAITELIGVVALGLANMMPVLLRRSSVYEVPITCGYACCMLGLVALSEALHGRHRVAYLAAASAMFGLAVGSRPLYVFSCAALLPVLWHAAQEKRLGFSAWQDPEWRRLAFAALLPLAGLGLGLAIYNFLRFGSPTDFGLRHQMTGDHITHLTFFAWRFFVYNLRVYGWAAAGWSPYFPFVEPAELPTYPEGNLGYEDPYGILVNIPFVLMAAGLWFAKGWNRLAVVASSALFAAAGTGLALAFYGAATNRYMVDFLPALVLLACLGLLAISERFEGSRLVRTIVSLTATGLVAYSSLFNIFASFVHNDILRTSHPVIYRQLARVCNWPSHLFDRLAGTPYGPIEMTVKFRPRPAGSLEPLVVTGHSVLSDYLVVHYVDKNLLQFGLEHTSRGSFFGEPFTYEAGRAYRLRIDLGSLYPPRDHPYFDLMNPDEAVRRQETLRVTCDDKIVLERRLRFYDASSRKPSIGSSEGRVGFPQAFSGEIIAIHRLTGAKLPPTSAQYGAIRLELRFPSIPGSRSEPLLSIGESGRGDLLYVRYEGPGRASFGYDHWGHGGDQGSPVSFDSTAVQVVEIDFEALHPPAPGRPGETEQQGRLVVRLNGQPALDISARYYRSPPHTVSIGINVIEASTASARFSGDIMRSTRIPLLLGSPP